MQRTARLLALLTAATTPLIAQSVTPYGTATPGLDGFQPRAWVEGEPRLGSTQFHLTVDRGTSGSLASLILGIAPARLPIAGIELLVDPGQPVFAAFPPIVLDGTPTGVGGAGSGKQLLMIPDVPALEGASLYGQWLVLDSSAAAGLAASDGVQFTMRDEPLFASTSPGFFEVVNASKQVFSQPMQAGGTFFGPLNVTRDGTTAFLILREIFGGGESFEWYDLTTQPPTFIGFGAGNAVSTHMHPNGQIAHIAFRDFDGDIDLGTMNVNRASPKFGQSTIVMPNLGTTTTTIATSADGRRLVYTGIFAPVNVVDIELGSPTQYQVINTFSLIGFPVRLVLSSDGATAFSTSLSTITQTDLSSGQAIATITAAGEVRDIALDPRGRFLVATLFDDNLIEVVDLEQGPGNYTSQTFAANSPQSVVLSADGASIVIATPSGYDVYDRATGQIFWSASSAAPPFALQLR